mmetsp:Transcript_85895/g.229116  ORF Transcript_85895/g.229116 Transcript_85895/m.229116 type:complete len:258 (-) Transcript_85895:1892-2665(-)
MQDTQSLLIHHFVHVSTCHPGALRGKDARKCLDRFLEQTLRHQGGRLVALLFLDRCRTRPDFFGLHRHTPLFLFATPLFTCSPLPLPLFVSLTLPLLSFFPRLGFGNGLRQRTLLGFQFAALFRLSTLSLRLLLLGKDFVLASPFLGLALARCHFFSFLAQSLLLFLQLLLFALLLPPQSFLSRALCLLLLLGLLQCALLLLEASLLVQHPLHLKGLRGLAFLLTELPQRSFLQARESVFAKLVAAVMRVQFNKFER